MFNRDYILSKLKNFDFLLFFIVLLLLAAGLSAIYSATFQSESEILKNNFQKQIYWIIIGFFFFLITYLLSKDHIYLASYIGYALFFILLILTIFLGKNSSAPNRWIKIGLVQIQPSEFLKIFTILSLAKYISENRSSLWQIKHIFVCFTLAIAPALVIIQQPDLGTAAVYFFAVFSMLYWSKIPAFYLYIIISPLITILSAFNFYTFLFWISIFMVILYFFKKGIIVSLANFILNISVGLITPFLWNNLKPYQQNRILTFFNLRFDPKGYGYQVIQSETAIGSGGLLGKGFTQGTQTQLKFLPVQHTDFIFSVVGEEFGFLGVTLILILFLIFILRIIKYASTSRGDFSSLLLFGISSIFLFHIFINVGMTIGLTPVTGIPLPFFSYGGSFLITCFIMLGLIMNFRHEERIF